MNRLLLLLCCICVPWMARGQAAYDWHYWFDMNHASQVNGQALGERFTIETDASGLSEGIHAFHVQVADTAGKFSPPHAQLFYHTHDRSIRRLHYWFDNDTENLHQVPTPLSDLAIDVSELEPGLHFIYCQVEDAAGMKSDVVCRAFYRQAIRSYLKWTYWFDDDQQSRHTVPFPNEVVMIDVSGLQEGFHVLHNQIIDVTASDITTTMFIKIPQTEGVDNMTCICTIDGKLVAQETLPAAGGVLKWNMDVDNMDVGIHKAMFQVITPSGTASSIAERYFVRVITNKELGSMKCVYAIDNFETFSEAGTLSDGLFHFDLDVATIENGLHRIAYMLVSEDGVTTPQKTAFFWKTPLGGDGIVQYDYWVNNNDDQKHSVQLDKRTNPFSLISLLPVEAQPIRSSNFQFAVKNGEPLIYARNEFHIQFFDTNGRMVEESKEYVDEQVSRTVDDLTWIDAGVRATTSKPIENTIKWYRLEAEQGDSLQFKLDRAATIQLFSPTGKEVYSASGSTSVAWGGCHVEETGIYYLALHDVMAQQGTTVSIDYNRIGKYAIMAYTPNSLSTDGTTIMYLKGNGLQYVQSVELVSDDIILAADTIVSNVTDLLARFTLNEGNDAVGNYYLRVCFHNEDEGESRIITQHQPITLRQADKGDITVKVVTERRVGDPYPIKVHLKNNGNVGLYGIPMNIAYDHPEMIDEFQFVNFDMLLSEDLYENRLFFAYTDDLVGTGKKGFFLPLLIPYLGPNEEKTFIFGVRTRIAHAKFNFYAWAGDPMYDGLSNDGENSGNKVRRKAPPCTPSNIPDVYDALGDADNLTNMPISPSRVLRPFIGAAEAISGIIQGSTRAREDAIFDAYGIPESERDDYRFQYRHCVRSPYDIARDAHPLQAPRRAGGAGGGAAVDGHANGDCPHPDPHPTDVYIPGDPNEITGYLAESGSHYIIDSIKTVGYDIEFENDPELANSSAHRIVIENQLDPEVFDLNSFVPNEIKLSDKTLELTGETPFIQTIDLRPNINAIAQVEGNYDANNGKIKWIIQSLDPMTMEPTDDIMQGVLPINNSNGDGIGHVTYSVDLRTKLEDGTEIPNQATIVFDYNEAIETPTWVNTVDAVPPTSTILGGIQTNDSTLTLRLAGEDARSGVWKYNVYAQFGAGTSWELVAENVTDTLCDVRIYEDIDYSFCVLATDSAGNVEKKVFSPEFSLSSDLLGDANGDGNIDLTDAVMITYHSLGTAQPNLNLNAADVNRDGVVDLTDAIIVVYRSLGTESGGAGQDSGAEPE